MIEQPAASSTPITTFEAQQGAPIPEQHSGVRLLVEAYVFIWIIAMIFVQITWLRQRGLARRIDSLERALDKAEASSDGRLDETVVKDRPKYERD